MGVFMEREGYLVGYRPGIRIGRDSVHTNFFSVGRTYTAHTFAENHPEFDFHDPWPSGIAVFPSIDDALPSTPTHPFLMVEVEFLESHLASSRRYEPQPPPTETTMPPYDMRYRTKWRVRELFVSGRVDRIITYNIAPCLKGIIK
jgi:hypothetical protein